jgi:hypothetical protein
MAFWRTHMTCVCEVYKQLRQKQIMTQTLLNFGRNNIGRDVSRLGVRRVILNKHVIVLDHALDQPPSNISNGKVI